jgi:hypothetical protein
LVGRSRRSHTNVTLPLQFCHLGPLFQTLLRPAGHPQNDLKFLLVGWSVGWSRGSYTNITLPLQFRHPGLLFPTLLRPAGHPQKALDFGWSIGRSVGRSVGQSVGHVEVIRTSCCLFSFVTRAFLTLLCPAGHPQNGLKFWLIGQSVSRSVGRSLSQSVRG